MRPVTQEIYGVPRERVIGSGVTLRYVADLLILIHRGA
jgi:hypothetical protein